MSPIAVVLFGANGQLGFELQRALAPLGTVHAVTRAQADLRDAQAGLQLLERLQPQVVVNAAAYTAVDKAEAEPELAQQINAVTPGRYAQWCAENHRAMVHYSSDYVFDGAKTRAESYAEGDVPAPQGAYGRSKLAGEQAVMQSGCEHLVLRTSWVVGAHGGNFAKTMLRLARERDTLRVVADQWGAPTSAALIADVTAHLLRAHLRGEGAGGLYHLAAAGVTNWCEYARFVIANARDMGLATRATPDSVQAITTADYPTPARRPHNSRLDCSRLQSTFGLQLP
ncbi:MAG: dTDP-4-dehydrorhamnose reductase, partial [Betaproteobacteria bacterium]|nr:dTDP-4-dehydrorhamnose reductase [Betaproteobacteria bacterium]